MKRRNFIAATSTIMAGTLINPDTSAILASGFKARKKIALVGTGIRGVTFWGKSIVDNYSDIVEFVGLCDKNPGRLEFAKKYMNINCPVFTNFDEMLSVTKPDLVIVTTVDATHHEFIVKGLLSGIDVLTEKPLTTDEEKCQDILDAERKSGKKLIVGFNYRYGTQFTKLKEILVNERVGKVTSVDFHWYLNTFHGASYFRRWHGERAYSGTLLIHKATHHFDLLNWFIDSDPVEVSAYGALEHYGANHSFRGDKCRTCDHKTDCKFFWDITKDEMAMSLYVDNEKYDGYIRDNCLWREEIDIYDKMSAQIKYANGVVVNYSLTTYSPYEGWRIAFNGMNGRIDSWEGIPWRSKEMKNQADLHKQEMAQGMEENNARYDEIMVMDNFGGYELVKVPAISSGHGGGDKRMQDNIFRNNQQADPLKHMAGSRDGAMSILVGVAARKSIETGEPVKIGSLTDLKPKKNRLV